MSAGSTKPVRSTIFDLDDTLIIEEEVARASLGKVAGLLPDRDPAHVADVLLTTAQQLWRAGPYRQICFDLGIASWEGLWATFEGGHPVLDGLRDWARTYRPAVWRQALATKAQLLWRVKKNASLACDKRLADGSYLSRVYPSQQDQRRQTNGIALRQVYRGYKKSPRQPKSN